MDNRTEAFWQSYLETLSANSQIRNELYMVESFGNSPEMADELGALIASEAKTATCSAFWEYETEGSPLSEVGEKTVVLDGNEDPLCIIETTKVEIRPYNEVDAQFAYEEGEGDCSLEHWREVHWRFFSRTLPEIGREPSPDMPLVCERFRVVYIGTQKPSSG